MAANGGGDGGHVRSKSDPSLLSDHKPIRPNGFSFRRSSISVDSVDFYFGGISNAEAMEEVKKFMTRKMEARIAHIDAVLDIWLRGHLRSRSDPQLLPGELRHMPIRPHRFFSSLRRSISMDSVEFYFRGFNDTERVMDSIDRFVTMTVELRNEVTDDDDDGDGDDDDGDYGDTDDDDGGGGGGGGDQLAAADGGICGRRCGAPAA